MCLRVNILCSSFGELFGTWSLLWFYVRFSVMEILKLEQSFFLITFQDDDLKIKL